MKQCSTCKWWAGFGEDDVANCKHEIPDDIYQLLELEQISREAIAGDKGEYCNCYEKDTDK